MPEITVTAPGQTLTKEEANTRKSVQAALAQKLQDLSLQFRKDQRSYLQSS